MYRPAFAHTKRLATALILCLALASTAAAENRYRAEVVVLERLADPILEERMSGKQPLSPVSEKRLLVVDANGNRLSDLDLTDDLTLNTAASRLENSGKYRVLMKAGWTQKFPQDYEGEPMRIEVGDYLERAGHRAVEGTIEVDRRRFLLVTAILNHWRPARGDSSSDGQIRSSEGTPGAEDDSFGVSARDDGKELITWIQETRRMRSQEIHFLDSPTIGVLVYFHKLD
ncbi:Peptidoglycan-binding protein, CsiV [Marinobacter daqiaonensis]|uniref:Peptidoglycan-binding protein, CsiV n=1 Tax=Marinobacter daqiaonensis TaxID=650891 RepID=A0A1I6H4Z5_9GAMM|nr:CsiV family protein [Marinobacter daqiaonensis]SFR49519.1 Peptidoglycan-binding protein, CsiV [Marinobacter daqiaonensis]